MDNIDMDLFRDRLRKRCKELKITHKVLAEKAGISESSIDKWLNGKPDNYNPQNKDYIPSLNLVYKVSQALGVSLDYFVNPNMDCLTVTNQAIKDMIGLDDTVINNLHCENIQAKKDGISREHCIDTVNFLLADKQGRELLTTIYNYLFGNYKELSNGNTILELRDGSGVPCNGGTVQVSSLNALFLSNIINNLAEIKADISKINGYDTYGKFDIKKVSDANQQKRAEILSGVPSFI